MTLNPETWHCYRGKQKFCEIADLDDESEVNFGELVRTGVLIYTGDEVVHLTAKQNGALGRAKRVREPKEIEKEASVYVHKDKVISLPLYTHFGE